MTTYIAFLRGINVGGKNIVKMAALKQLFENQGVCQVETYIQSGNVLFQSAEQEDPLREKLEQAFEATFGFSVPLVLRTAEELAQLFARCPFSPEIVAAAEAEAGSGVECLYVALLPSTPAPEHMAWLDPYINSGDRCQIIGRDVYLLFHHSIRQSKLAGNLHKLHASATVRNWNTLSRLSELAAR